MAWYTTGTVTVTASNNTVTGSGTNFIANARVGDAFRGSDGRWYEVTNIASATAISISPVYQGSTASAQAYSIAPMQGYVKASADALRQITETYGTTLAAIKPWATAATGSIALDNLGFGATGKAIAAAANTAAAQTAIDIVKTTSASDTTAGRVWRTNDLVKVSSTTDAADGRVTTVGWMGLGAGGQDVPNMTVTDVNIGRFFRLTSGATGGSGQNGGVIAIPYGGGGPTTGYLQVNPNGRVFSGVKSSSTGAPTWTEQYGKSNTSEDVQSALAAANNAAIRTSISSSIFPSYTVATVPLASANANLGIIVTNASGAAGRRPFWSNGTVWRDAAGATLS